jgi:TrpR-related protein YerC/YecD
MKYIDPNDWQLFCQAILQLEGEEECRAFFEDICTIKEMQDITQRLRVASMLDSGKNYQEISSATGASTATICRVNKCLNYGEGYRLALDKMRTDAEESKDEKR